MKLIFGGARVLGKLCLGDTGVLDENSGFGGAGVLARAKQPSGKQAYTFFARQTIVALCTSNRNTGGPA
jgi:hypothetical protein